MLLLYPSFYEGFGIPIIESQRAGCPIIAYKQSSIPEIMGNTDYALSDISIDSIIEAVSFLSTHYQERENEINRGLENSQRFSWDMTYKKTIDLYKKIYEKK